MTHLPLFRIIIRNCEFPDPLLLIEGTTFRMGSDKATDPDAYEDEEPPHEVTVPAFYLGRYPVTQALWRVVMGDNNSPSYFTGSQRPVEQVSWDDAQEFLKKLRDETEQLFRLPTEAEWEFAACGGALNTGCKYSGTMRLKEVGWFTENSHGETKPVGQKFPNELGLYDMSGNVWEWCNNDRHDIYKDEPEGGSDWVDQALGTYRRSCGGSWLVAPQFCRTAHRFYWLPDDRGIYLGFRLALSL